MDRAWPGHGAAPRLVPQDAKAQAVYYLPRERCFLGKVNAADAQFELLYAKRAKDRPPDQRKELPPILSDLVYGTTWENASVAVDFAKAHKVAPPKPGSPLSKTSDDLELLWATAQAEQFAVLQAQAPEFGFFGFAREATQRKYGVASTLLADVKPTDHERIHRDAYALTSGAAAITESLQLHRLRGGVKHLSEERTIDVEKVEGITIAEHPWRKMMEGKQPAPEPLAKLVPHDNYYVHFKDLARFLELGELIDQWGGNITSLYDLNSRDYQVKQRYEQQLCIKSTWLGKALGPLVIRSLAITGNDPYLREGSDVTVLFHVVNRALFLAGVDPFLQEARKEFGAALRETKYEHEGVTVEHLVTPLREVSLHRASIGDIVIYSNSPAGMKRVLETYQGKMKSLADSLDFQYMRTVMRRDDKLEDGFVFLSDPFIRQLVGPASKIKQRRRIEALTSLAMVTNAALFHAWETGDLPADHAALMKATRLAKEEIAVPEGKGVQWDGQRKTAVSDAYNTLHFATPLIELPIDKVTRTEASEYEQFRRQYLGLWRQYFDPVGIRLQLTDSRIRLETYILPLVATSQYNFLRTLSGNGDATFDLSRVAKETLFQWFAHVTIGNILPGVGDQITVRIDDDAIFDKFAELYIRRQLRPAEPDLPWGHFAEEARLVLQMPLTLGVKIANEGQFDKELAILSRLLDDAVGKNERRNFDYKGITITGIKFTEDSTIVKEIHRDKPAQMLLPTLFHAKVDGFWYVSFREEPIKSLIDQGVTRGDRLPRESDLSKGNTALQLAPPAAVQARRGSSSTRSGRAIAGRSRTAPPITRCFAPRSCRPKPASRTCSRPPSIGSATCPSARTCGRTCISRSSTRWRTSGTARCVFPRCAAASTSTRPGAAPGAIPHDPRGAALPGGRR